MRVVVHEGDYSDASRTKIGGMNFSSSKPLFVAAVDGEASELPEGTEVLVTGIGTLPAAITLAKALAEADERPSRVVNIGTAGALRDGLVGVFEVDSVTKHDFFLEDHSGIQQYLLPETIEVETSGRLPTASLATGDKLIGDSKTRERLAQRAGLCDMEGYAVAAVCERFGVPYTLLKQVSDSADEVAEEAWADAVDQGARQLVSALTDLGFIES